MECLNISIKGIVQGVGFRPFIYNLANEMAVKGFVTNTSDGVVMTVEGSNLDLFVERIRTDAPPLSKIMSIEISPSESCGYPDFSIKESSEAGSFTLVSSDISVCQDCLEEMFDRKDRRYLYPFINCTNCGPRYSITKSVPYDRINTTMNDYKMCRECDTEYHNPVNRRFHAQPNACPECGPQLEFKVLTSVRTQAESPGRTSRRGRQNLKFKVQESENPVESAINVLKQGGIVAVKGLGGFHIACDATNRDAVERLRELKRRNNKPFALMVPDISSARKYCHVSEEEEALLISNKRPIVLLKKYADSVLPEAVAPNNRYSGIMLPYTPLHYLLFHYPVTKEFISMPAFPVIPACRESFLRFQTDPRQSGDKSRKDCGQAAMTDTDKQCLITNELISNNEKKGYLPETHYSSLLTNFSALVMTSGNLAEEPIVIGNDDAVSKLSGIADAFLLHNRDIFMRVDDSVVRLMSNELQDTPTLTLPPRGGGLGWGGDSSLVTRHSSLSFIRRSRGYVPDPIPLNDDGPEVLGCGADLKNTFTLTKGGYAIPSQHIGDMENYETLKFFEETLENLKAVYRADPSVIAYDLHPKYLSTQWALRQGSQGTGRIKTYGIQHHYAHIASVMAEKGIKEKVIGVSFDGTGYGEDGTLWGGEFLVADTSGFKRAGHIKEVPLPGGETAIREPWRISLSYLKEAAGDEVWDYLKPAGFPEKYGEEMIANILKISGNKEFSPLSSGAGRLFDAVSALTGICDKNTFEGEAAIALESLLLENIEEDYPVNISFKDPLDMDFSQTILNIIDDIRKKEDIRIISTKFHNTVAGAIIRVVIKLSLINNIKKIILSGGVFQNLYLLNMVVNHLRSEGLTVYTNEIVPCNDAGISLGQAYIIRERLKAGII